MCLSMMDAKNSLRYIKNNSKLQNCEWMEDFVDEYKALMDPRSLEEINEENLMISL